MGLRDKPQSNQRGIETRQAHDQPGGDKQPQSNQRGIETGEVGA